MKSLGQSSRRMAGAALLMLLFLATSVAMSAGDIQRYKALDLVPIWETNNDAPDEKIVGWLQEDEEVDCEAVDDLWLRVDYKGKTGYLQKFTMTEVEGAVPAKTSKPKNESIFDQLNFNSFPKTTSKVIFWITAVLSLLMALLYMGRIKEDDELDDHDSFYAISTVFLLASIGQIAYFATWKDDDTWFVSSREVGWLWTIVNFCLYCWVMLSQVLSLKVLLAYSSVLGHRNVSFSIGLWGWVGGFGAALFCSLFAKGWLDYVFYAFLATQAIQLVMLILHPGEWFNLVFTIVFYVVGTVATFLMGRAFLGVFLPVLLCGIFFHSAGTGASSSYGRTRKYEVMHTEHDGIVYGYWNEHGEFVGQNGHRYSSGGIRWD